MPVACTTASLPSLHTQPSTAPPILAPCVWCPAEKSVHAHERAALIAQLAGAAQQAAVDLGATIVPGGRGKPKPAGQPMRPGMPVSAPMPMSLPVPMPGSGVVPGMPPALPMLPQVVVAQGLPSRSMILKNMFDPKDMEEEGWDEDICEDVKEECSKHGPVTHVSVEPNQLGLVYVLFRCEAWRRVSCLSSWRCRIVAACAALSRFGRSDTHALIVDVWYASVISRAPSTPARRWQVVCLAARPLRCSSFRKVNTVPSTRPC
jgi:hypothetical protein